MAEQLAVEVDVKNVTEEQQQEEEQDKPYYLIWIGNRFIIMFGCQIYICFIVQLN